MFQLPEAKTLEIVGASTIPTPHPDLAFLFPYQSSDVIALGTFLSV